MIESKYTGPFEASVAQALAAKAAASPSRIGRSMPIGPARSWLQAPRMIGTAENSITGTVSTSCARRSSCSMSAGMSPALAT